MQKKRFWSGLLIVVGMFAHGSGVVAQDDDTTVSAGLWLHPSLGSMPTDLLGPFVRLNDGGIFTVDDENALVSHDEGKTWQAQAIFTRELTGRKRMRISGERAILKTRSGAVIVAFINLNEMVWHWNDKIHDADQGTRLPNYVMRSEDGGKTWDHLTMVHEDWTGAVRDMVQMPSGRITFVSQKLLHHPGRHAVVTYYSDDDGRSWRSSNTLDLGGMGHHGGAIEGTIETLADGRLWMLLRTNWDRFWQAYSLDGGVSWRVIEPSNIDAASAPGMLKRLSSGRLVLIWNRLYPQGKTEFPRTGGDGGWSEVPASNQREELSIMFSEDDGRTWTPPIVFARRPNAWLAYPYIFEVQPGVLWVSTMQGELRLVLREKDFIGVERAGSVKGTKGQIP